MAPSTLLLSLIAAFVAVVIRLAFMSWPPPSTAVLPWFSFLQTSPPLFTTSLQWDAITHIVTASPANLGAKKECCYAWMMDKTRQGKTVPTTLTDGETYSPDIPYWLNMTNRIPLPKLKKKPSTKIPGESTSSFFLDCDIATDRLQLRREVADYDVKARTKYLSRQVMVDTFDANNESMDHSKFPSRTIACTEWARMGGVKHGLACTVSVDASVQTRFANVYSEICATRGSFHVLLTPPSNITSVAVYPSIHPMRFQSTIMFDDLTHAMSAKARGLLVEVIPVQLQSWNTSAMCIGIPPYWPFRIAFGAGILATDKSFDFEYAEHFQSNIRESLVIMSKNLPRMLQYGALENQPLWFGMWGLAVYMDAILELDAKTRNEKEGKELRQVAKQRWGMENYYRRGYADDPLDSAPRAVEIAKDVTDECGELMKTPKDLMLVPTDRDKLLVEINDAAQATRTALYKAMAFRSAQSLELLTDQTELAIAETLSPAGIRPFLQCYWGGSL